MLRKYVLSILVIAMVFTHYGCTTNQTITRRSQLSNPIETGTIMVLMKDKTLYELNNYRLTDSLLFGSGSVMKNKVGTPYIGQLRLSDIASIQAQNTSFMKTAKTAITASLIVFFTTKALSALIGDGSSMKVEEGYYTPYRGGGGGGGGSSCPFIYSWNGNRYVLEAEAFGIGFGKALELNTCSVLPSLKDEGSKVQIRITNERPETHYFNAAQLVAVETDSSASVVADADNTMWPVYQSIAPVTAVDQSRNSVVEKIREHDQKYWESDLSQISVFSDFQDVLDLKFTKPAFCKEGSLVIHAINTKFVNAVFENIFQFLGDQSMTFMQAVEHDPELISTLKEWIVEGSLKAYVWNGKDWEKIGVVYPEANVTPFSRLIRFRTDHCVDDTIKIRLVSLADVWKLDAVQMDWTPVQPLKSRTSKLLSAVGPEEKDFSRPLRSADDNYAVLLPPEQIDLVFASVHASPGKKTTYALNVQGYLHEWFPESKNPARFALMKDLQEETKVVYLKNLLKHKSIFLPLIYSEWKQMRNAKQTGEDNL